VTSSLEMTRCTVNCLSFSSRRPQADYGRVTPFAHRGDLPLRNRRAYAIFP
jgi:hypothetical protein